MGNCCYCCELNGRGALILFILMVQFLGDHGYQFKCTLNSTYHYFLLFKYQWQCKTKSLGGPMNFI